MIKPIVRAADWLGAFANSFEAGIIDLPMGCLRIILEEDYDVMAPRLCRV